MFDDEKVNSRDINVHTLTATELEYISSCSGMVRVSCMLSGVFMGMLSYGLFTNPIWTRFENYAFLFGAWLCYRNADHYTMRSQKLVDEIKGSYRIVKISTYADRY